MRKILKLDSFWIRIIALVTMTIDHIGTVLGMDYLYSFRLIGRLAFPLFLFLSVEGAFKTSNRKNYILRLLIYAGVISVILTVLTFMGGFYTELAFGSGNTFIDLLLIVLSIEILESPNKKIKPLVALPILYMLFCAVVTKLEGCGCDGLYYWLFPAFRTQYNFFSLFLGFGFYFAKKLAPKVSPLCVDPEVEQLARNLLSIFALLVTCLIFFVICLAFGSKYNNPLDDIQTYAAIAGIFILFYNGKKGYNAKWFRVAYYLYYPVHIAIISLILLIIGV